MDRGKIYKVKAQVSDEVLIEEKTIKTYGNNYMAAKVKNKINLALLLKLIVGFFILTTLVLGVLVLCGI